MDVKMVEQCMCQALGGSGFVDSEIIVCRFRPCGFTAWNPVLILGKKSANPSLAFQYIDWLISKPKHPSIIYEKM
jgi:hypothetical protein